MARLAEAKVKQVAARGAEQRLDLLPPVKMGAMGAPGADDPVCRLGKILNNSVILWANRVRFGPHHPWVGRPKGKDIGHGKAAKPQRPRPPFAAFDGGVILNLGRGRGVQHHEQGTGARCPDPGQGIAIAQVKRIQRRAGGIAGDGTGLAGATGIPARSMILSSSPRSSQTPRHWGQ